MKNKELAEGSVTVTKIADNSVTGAKVADGSLTGADIDLGTLGSVPAAHAVAADEAANALKLGGLAPAEFQRRVTGACTGGDAIQAIDESGDVSCQPTGTGTITGVTTTGGLTGGGSAGGVTVGTDPTVLQRRVSGTCAAGTAISTVAQDGGVSCSAAFAPASQVLSSGRVNVTTPFSTPLLQSGGITVASACEAFAGEADVTMSVNAGSISYAADTIGGAHAATTNLPNGVGAVIGRTTTVAQVVFSAVTSAGKTLNGQVLMIRNGPTDCTYEATGVSGG